MFRTYKFSLVFLVLFISLTSQFYAYSQIVFTRSQYTRQGFEDSILKSSSNKGWWELYSRDICRIDPDGTNFMQLTTNGVSYHPKWSPDGQKIAYLSGPPPKVSLYIMDSDGSKKKELVASQMDIYEFKWSPDSTSVLVYLKSKRTINPEEAWVISITNGVSTKQMGSTDWARGWNHWAPKGATVINPDRRLMDGLPAGTVWPQWSPDGLYIAFIHNGKIAIADTATTGRPEKWKPSKEEPPCDKIGDWSPDGSKILFFAAGNVCSINVDEKGVVNLSMSRSTDACWSPDGSQIAYTSTDGRKSNTEIFIMNSDGTGHIQLTNTNYFHTDIDWK